MTVGLQNIFPRKQCDQELTLQEECRYLVEEDFRVFEGCSVAFRKSDDGFVNGSWKGLPVELYCYE